MYSILKSVAVQILFLVAVAILCCQNIRAQDEVQCLGQDLNMTQEQKNVITDCLKEAKILSIWKVPMEKIACFGICILEKKNLLNDDGGLNHDKIYTYIMNVMKPDSVKKPIVDGVEKCMKDHGTKVRQPNDPNCITFTEVGQCVHEIFLAQCVEG